MYLSVNAVNVNAVIFVEQLYNFSRTFIFGYDVSCFVNIILEFAPEPLDVVYLGVIGFVGFLAGGFELLQRGLLFADRACLFVILFSPRVCLRRGFHVVYIILERQCADDQCRAYCRYSEGCGG